MRATLIDSIAASEVNRRWVECLKAHGINPPDPCPAEEELAEILHSIYSSHDD